VRHAVGVFIVHHGNKPLRGRKRRAGRRAISLPGRRQRGVDQPGPVFARAAVGGLGERFRAGGEQARQAALWKDGSGKVVTKKHVAHNAKEGVISWHLARRHEIAAAGWRAAARP
jgi:hypothetical protein